MTLMERARQLLPQGEAKSGKRWAAGALALAPLAVAPSVYGAAIFDSPGTQVYPGTPKNTNGFNGSDNLSSQLLSNGTQLKLFGTASGSGESGSQFTLDLSWYGNWATAPTVGELFNVSYDATATFDIGPAPVSTGWKLLVDLNGDGTPDYTDSGSGTSTLNIAGSGTVQAPTASASNYYVDLLITDTISSFDAVDFGMHVNIPTNSIDIGVAPEPSSILVLSALLAPVVLRRRRSSKCF